MIEVEEHRLGNGLRVVLAPDRTTAVTGVNLWYGVGSRNETDGRTGFAHLFEHMMFQGSAHIPKNGHFHHIERVGDPPTRPRGSTGPTTSRPSRPTTWIWPSGWSRTAWGGCCPR